MQFRACMHDAMYGHGRRHISRMQCRPAEQTKAPVHTHTRPHAHVHTHTHTHTSSAQHGHTSARMHQRAPARVHTNTQAPGSEDGTQKPISLLVIQRIVTSAPLQHASTLVRHLPCLHILHPFPSQTRTTRLGLFAGPSTPSPACPYVPQTAYSASFPESLEQPASGLAPRAKEYLQQAVRLGMPCVWGAPRL